MSLHEFIPDKRADHDECSVCGSDFEASCHPAINHPTAGTRARRTDCDYGHDRWRYGRCLECSRLYMQARRTA